MQEHFGEKKQLSLSFLLLFNEALSENVLSFRFWFQNITYLFLGKVTKFSE